MALTQAPINLLYHIKATTSSRGLGVLRFLLLGTMKTRYRFRRLVGILVIATTVAGLPFLAPVLTIRTDQTELVPQHGPARYVKSSSKPTLYDDRGNATLFLMPNAPVYLIEAGESTAHVEVYGWIWSESLITNANHLTLLPTLKQENMRISARYTIIGRVMQGAALERIGVGPFDQWTLCRAVGWIDNSSLTESKFEANSVPLVSVTSRSAGALQTTTIISENLSALTIMIFAVLALGFHLLSPTRLFLRIQKDSGTLNDKMSVAERGEAGQAGMPREPILTIGSRIATPLALSGFTIAVVYLLFRTVLLLGIFPQLSELHSFLLLKLLLNSLFVLGVTALTLGLAAYVVDNIKRKKESRRATVSDSVQQNAKET